MGNTKLFRYILIALLGVSAVLGLLFMTSIIGETLLINWCYVLLAIAALAAIVFPILNMVQNPKNAKAALIGVGVLIVVFVIGYAIAGAEEYIDREGNVLADAATSRKSEAGLIAFYIMGIGAIGAIVYAEISKMLK